MYGIHLSRLMIKPTKWHVRQTKTKINLGIRPVRSESSLSAWRNLGSLATHWTHCEDWSAWAKGILSLRWAHGHFVDYVMRRLISSSSSERETRERWWPVKIFLLSICHVWENLSYANNKVTDQPAHPRSFVSVFVVRSLDSIIPNLLCPKFDDSG